MFEIIRQILFDMKQHKLRTFLALFGIIWGTAAVVLLVAIGDGFYNANKKGLEAIGQNSIFIMPGNTSLPYKGMGQNRPIMIKSKDAENLAAKVPGIASVSPNFYTFQNISYNKTTLGKMLMGVAPGFQSQDIQIAPGGRFINSLDVKQSANSVFLGYKLAKVLFADKNPIGQSVFIFHVPMRVVGVLSSDSDGTMLNNASAADTAYISYSTFELFKGKQNINYLLVNPKKNADREAVTENIHQYFANQFHFDPKDKTALSIPDTNQFSTFIKWFFYGIQLFLAFCGLLTLAVGGIGIANTLFLIVSERTPEIGLRIALGARDYHILVQVLLESFLLVFIGGLIGLFLASSIIGLLNALHLPNGFGKPHIDLINFIVTFLTLLMIGLAAGYFPARKAAKLQPIEALAF